MASLCLLHVLLGVDLMSPGVEDLSQRYARDHSSSEGLLCYHTINTVHTLLVDNQEHHTLGWMDYKPYPQEHALFAHTLVWVAYQARKRQNKVPRWVLRFVLHSLSSDPLPSTSVIMNCLSIIAIDLGCDVSTARTTTLDERYVILNKC